MIRQLVGAGAVAALLGGMGFAVAGPAEAATSPAKCALGNWSLVGEKGVEWGNQHGTKYRDDISGAGGTRLTIGKGSYSLNFAHSKREYATGNVNGSFSQWTQYTGGLKVASSVSGNHVFTQPKTATGNARRSWHYIRPKRKGGSADIVFDLRHGSVETFVPASATFSCKGSKLVLTARHSDVVPGAAAYTAFTFTYRRV